MADYFNEDWVRGKIENWHGRPAGGQSHPLLVSEIESLRREVRRMQSSPVPVDHTDADITSRTLLAIDEQMAHVLMAYHTTTLTLGRIAYDMGVSRTECSRLVSQGHVDFCEEWERQKYLLRDELRRLAPAVDPSAKAEPQVALERDKPTNSKWVTPPEAAPVLDYRKTQTSAGKSK